MNTFDEFANLVKKYFDYLEKDYGYHVTLEPSKSSVFYQLNSKQIVIRWDYSFHHELDLVIFPIPRRQLIPFQAVEIERIMELKDPKTYGSYYPPRPSTLEEVEHEIIELAGLLKKYGSDILPKEISFDTIYKRAQDIKRIKQENLQEIIKRQEPYYRQKYPTRFRAK
jgi:hypothetical protein